MKSTSVITASVTPIPSNPQVITLSFPHHSMLLLSNQSSEVKAVTSNPHSLFPFSLTNRLDAHETLSQSTANSLTVSNKQGSTHSISSETTDYGRSVWRVESRNLWVSFSQNASGSLINIVHLSTDRVVGELRTLTSHVWLLSHHSSGEEKSDGSTAHSWFIRKIVRDTREEIPELRHAYWNGRWWGWGRWRDWRRDGTEWYGKDDWVVWARWSMR